MTEPLGRFVDSDPFQHGVLAVIVMAAVLVGLETSRDLVARHGALLHGLDKVVLGIFILEAALKIGRHGRGWYRYFADPWNVFDFLIVVVCLLPVGGQYAAVLRLARVLRGAAAGDGRSQAATAGQLAAQVDPLPGLRGVAADGAVLGVRGDGDLSLPGQRPRPLPGPVHVAAHPLPGGGPGGLDGRDVHPDGSDAYPGYADFALAHLREASRARPILGAAFFVSFVMLGTMIMLNLFIGVIINSMSEAKAEKEAEERRRHLERDGEISVGDEIRLPRGGGGEAGTPPGRAAAAGGTGAAAA